MKRWKQIARRFVARNVIKLLLSAVKQIIAWEIITMAQDECKHEGQSGTFCGLCGKQLQDPEDKALDDRIGGIMRKVLVEEGLIKPKPKGSSSSGSLADRLLPKGKK